MTYVISGRNINDLYPQALHLVQRDGVLEDSRNGRVRVVGFPVLTVTEQPTERVLFDRNRDANPFFHLFECLWMLNGDSDARWLDRFVSDFSSRFAETETEFPSFKHSRVEGHIFGAYGARWRRWFGLDQLKLSADRLRADPKDRRVVISMWDGYNDFQGLDEEPYRDVPCNTHMYPRIVDGRLDLSVCVRSNDVIWGAYGANAVHMTFVQEYLSGLIGVPVGKFYQFSNNWHAYENVLNRFAVHNMDHRNLYRNESITPIPFMDHPMSFDEELQEFMLNPENFVPTRNMWLMLTAQRALYAHNAVKEKKWGDAKRWAEAVEAPDWSIAMVEWIERRRVNWEQKNA